MKFCPTCQTRYDEEILRFCTKDGTPLVDENQPNFTTMPSQSSIEDFGEETVISRNKPQAPPPLPADEQTAQERIVIPTTEAVRAKNVPPGQAPPRKSNTATVVLLTLLGTFAVLGAIAGGWFLLQNRDDRADANRNVNTNANSVNQNVNTNVDSSLGNFNFNINTNANVNANTNVNANLKTPTPTPTKTPTPTPTKTPTPDANANTGNVNANVVNTPAPLPSPTPTPTRTPAPQNVNAGLLNSRAVTLTKPAYPPIARQANASGQVTVQVTLDEEGNVLSARAVNGHTLLRSSAEAAARQSKFNPVRGTNGQPARATGIILYNFINQ